MKNKSIIDLIKEIKYFLDTNAKTYNKVCIKIDIETHPTWELNKKIEGWFYGEIKK